MVARGALLIAAVVVGGWLALQLHSTRLEADAPAGALGERAPALTPQRLDAAVDVLHRAERHNPNLSPDIVEGSVLIGAHRYGEASAVLGRVAHAEPDNITAQGLLRFALEPIDPAAAAAVARRVRELAPPVPEP